MYCVSELPWQQSHCFDKVRTCVSFGEGVGGSGEQSEDLCQLWGGGGGGGSQGRICVNWRMRGGKGGGNKVRTCQNVVKDFGVSVVGKGVGNEVRTCRNVGIAFGESVVVVGVGAQLLLTKLKLRSRQKSIVQRSCQLLSLILKQQLHAST